MQEVTVEMIRAAYATDAEPIALLATLDAAGMDEPIRVTTWPKGLVSNGQQFHHFPFTFKGGGASTTEPARSCTLEIANSDGRIVEAAKSVEANTQPTLTVETVRVSDPDQIEQAIVGAEVQEVGVDGPAARATVMPRNFAAEPACSARQTPSRLPGLF